MANDQAMKKNQASLQVLKTLKVLLEDNYTMSEIVDRLNSQEKEPIFNNSVVSKYINTCRYCGIEISKIRNRYYVIKMPFGINFDINIQFFLTPDIHSIRFDMLNWYTS